MPRALPSASQAFRDTVYLRLVAPSLAINAPTNRLLCSPPRFTKSPAILGKKPGTHGTHGTHATNALIPPHRSPSQPVPPTHPGRQAPAPTATPAAKHPPRTHAKTVKAFFDGIKMRRDAIISTKNSYNQPYIRLLRSYVPTTLWAGKP